MENEDFTKIVNARHFHRLKGYFSDGTILFGGQSDERLLKINPTLI
ncbi:MAG TPA: hypothetical protein VEY70_01390 [Metabacillus sp.]|nr:hypothetical protein [Metabacillus sp.]